LSGLRDDAGETPRASADPRCVDMREAAATGLEF